MKKTLLAITTMAIILTGCDNSEALTNVKTPNQTMNTEERIDQLDSANATEELPPENHLNAPHQDPEKTEALAWTGTYDGTLPCADCDGIETELTLNPNQTYQLTEIYLGQSNQSMESSGVVEWDEAGQVLTLHSDDGSDPVQYQIDDRYLTRLNHEGKPSTGNLESLYHLKKQG